MILPSTQIPSPATTWQLSIAAHGEVVTEIDSIAQSVRILLETEPGSDPLRPEFGIGLLGLIGRPVNEAGALLRRRGKQQFTDYLPGVEVNTWRVTAEEDAPGTITATIEWTWRGSTFVTSVTV